MQVAQAPERYARGNVIWGGTVVSVKNLAGDTEIEVLAYPLDASQRPRLKGAAAGRFIAVLSGYVEPLNYPPGSPITVSGTLNGSRAGKVGQAGYVFPLVQVTQSHRWTADEMQRGHPNIHFGVGVGVGIR
jgi:outer membrane lipoprotein